MDILSFVNSKDIRNYLHEIDYKCDSMQAAWLVYQSYEVMFNYMDLELFKGHLEGQERLLIALSNYVKGEISEELLLHAQRVLIMHDLGYNSQANWYTEEELELAGIAGLKELDLTRSERKKRKKKIEKRWKDHSYT